MSRLCYLVTLWVVLMAVGCSASTPVLPATPTPSVASAVITPTSLPSMTPTASATATATSSPTATRIPPTPTVAVGEGCNGGERVVVLILDPRLVNGIRAGLDQFTRDLCNDGYTVIRRLADFPTPADLRVYLAQLYAQTKQKLGGVILIGDVPRAYQLVNTEGVKPIQEELISFQYFADLNGTFEASPNYKSPGKHPFSFDVHTGEMNWELWIGLLPLYKSDVAKTIDAINRYFVKNHAYRLGQSTLPRVFLQINEHSKSTSSAQDAQNLGFMKSGPYTWGPFASASNSRLYLDSTTPSLSLDRGYADLSAGVVDFAVLQAHGSYRASGKLTINWVETKPVRTIFFWSDGCAVGNLDYADNFLTAVLYSPTSEVLVARGTTNDSGGMGNNQNGFYGANIATALSRKQTFGEALLYHVNTPLIDPWAKSREFHFATLVTLGDPTLRLR